MTYWNPVLAYGVERFADDLVAAGGAGLITPDLIPDEAGEWLAASDARGLDRVFLAAPTSSDERLDAAVAASRGFVYTVSTMGITGARMDVDAAARTLVAPAPRRTAPAARASASASRAPSRSPRSSPTPTARSSAPRSSRRWPMAASTACGRPRPASRPGPRCESGETVSR